jgi:hypothetical protein
VKKSQSFRVNNLMSNDKKNSKKNIEKKNPSSQTQVKLNNPLLGI